MTRTPKAQPFASNLEYLVATLDYLQTLARTRIASRQIETERGGMRASRHEMTEREELLGSAAGNPAGLQHLLRRLNTEVRHKQDALNRRTQITLAAGTPELPLENLARDYGLSEFEKLVLVIVLGPDLDSNFSRVMEALSHSHGVEMGCAVAPPAGLFLFPAPPLAVRFGVPPSAAAAQPGLSPPPAGRGGRRAAAAQPGLSPPPAGRGGRRAAAAQPRLPPCPCLPPCPGPRCP